MNHAFRVEIPERELSFEVGSEESIVQAAALHGVEILTACENGQCGTCVVKVLDGEPEHRDSALSQEKREEGWICACVSRAKGKSLVLELW